MSTSSSVLLPSGGQRILVVQAHPDDAEHICGGTIALLVAEGKDIHYLLVTRGDKGTDNPEMTIEQVAAIREQEQRKAASVQGVQTVTFLNGYFDGEVEPTLQLRRDIAFVLRQWKPDVVFTFDPWRKDEPHPDHRAVGITTLDALACARGVSFYPEQLKDGVTPHSVKHLYYFLTDRPNHWVDISNVIDKKVRALSCHQSQMRNINNDPDAWVRRKAIVEGFEHRYQYGEPFHHMVM
jgi:LmbE family N-acetylglucosaminyl deacetylase